MSDSYSSYLVAYVPVLAIIIIGVGLVGAMMAGNRLLRPSRPTPQKLLTYECGVDPVGSGWAQMHVRYYIFAYLYVVFAVDAVFLFPWATVFESMGGVTIAEMGIFVGILTIGLGYAWRKDVLTWT
jgi:NADH-quinone oxidoreductase subunit A